VRITRYALIGVVIGLILVIIGHPLIGVVLIAAAIAIPAVGYAMLSPEQRRRLREQRRRRQIGS
jgi:sulfite exporter TauE/SafE